jgi:3-phenylpropionate/trans-cinnamate dioxygenase ferredoxin subunit
VVAEVTITATENGPYKVEGPIDLRDQDGNPIENTRSTVFLCRCGGSTKKPFCDGTHSRIGFRAAREAVAEADAEGEGERPAGT